MTVYELIKRLAKYNPDSRVYTYDDCDVFEVEGVGIDDEKLIIGTDPDELEPKREPYPNAECFDTGKYVYAFINIKAPGEGMPYCAKCGTEISKMDSSKDSMMGNFWITHFKCGCGSEGIRIVFPGEDYTSPIVDDEEKY